MNEIFILRESDLLRIYITMLDENSNSIQNSSEYNHMQQQIQQTEMHSKPIDGVISTRLSQYRYL